MEKVRREVQYQYTTLFIFGQNKILKIIMQITKKKL